MDLNIVILAIIVTSVATFISRFSGALTSEKVNAKSKRLLPAKPESIDRSRARGTQLSRTSTSSSV